MGVPTGENREQKVAAGIIHLLWVLKCDSDQSRGSQACFFSLVMDEGTTLNPP